MRKVDGRCWIDWEHIAPYGETGGKMKIAGDSKEEKVMSKVTTNPAMASAKVGITHNLGNFESLRLDIAVEIPVGDNQTVAQAIDEAYAIAEEKLIEKFHELRREVTGE